MKSSGVSTLASENYGHLVVQQTEIMEQHDPVNALTINIVTMNSATKYC
jgi:hypothetical protein